MRGAASPMNRASARDVAGRVVVSELRVGSMVHQSGWLPWADTGSWFTRPFEDHVGYLAQRGDQTTVSSMMRVSWDTVGAIIQRVVGRHRDRDPLDASRRSACHVVWASPGKNADTLKAFFDDLGPER
jgi:hypothetical protein